MKKIKAQKGQKLQSIIKEELEAAKQNILDNVRVTNFYEEKAIKKYFEKYHFKVLNLVL